MVFVHERSSPKNLVFFVQHTDMKSPRKRTLTCSVLLSTKQSITKQSMRVEIKKIRRVVANKAVKQNKK